MRCCGHPSCSLDSCNNVSQVWTWPHILARLSSRSTILAMKNFGFSWPMVPTLNVESWRPTLWKTQVFHSQVLFGGGALTNLLLEERPSLSSIVQECAAELKCNHFFLFFFFKNHKHCCGNLSWSSYSCNKKGRAHTFDLVGREEHGFSTSIGANSRCQELVPMFVENPCSSWFFLLKKLLVLLFVFSSFCRTSGQAWAWPLMLARPNSSLATFWFIFIGCVIMKNLGPSRSLTPNVGIEKWCRWSWRTQLSYLKCCLFHFACIFTRIWRSTTRNYGCWIGMLWPSRMSSC